LHNQKQLDVDSSVNIITIRSRNFDMHHKGTCPVLFQRFVSD